MSINKIHVNNTTKISLNDRFTVMQSVGPKSPTRKVGRRRNSSYEGGAVPKASLANRRFLEQLDKKHKAQTALKLKRRSLKAHLPNRERIRNRIGLKKGAANTIRLASNGKLTRANSLSNVATMKADLIEPGTLRRSNSTSNIAARLGNSRRFSAFAGLGRQQQQQQQQGAPRRRLNRNTSLVRSNSRSNLIRSNSLASLRRSNSKSNLRRANSKLNLNRSGGGGPGGATSNGRGGGRGARNIGQIRRNSSINSRGRRAQPPLQRNNLNRTRSTLNVQRRNQQTTGRQGVARGRITKRRNSTGLSNKNTLRRAAARQERPGRSRGRGNMSAQRGRSRSQSTTRRKNNVNGPGLRRNNGFGGNPSGGPNKGKRGSGRGRSRGRGNGRPLAQKPEIKKEELDKELDQYMANTKTALDKEMDVYMNNATF